MLWMISLGWDKADAKTENKVCSLSSKLETLTVSYRTELLTDFMRSQCLMEVKKSAEAGCFLSFSFLQKHSKDLIFYCLHWLKGAGDVKMHGFLSRFVKVFDSLDLSFRNYHEK